MGNGRKVRRNKREGRKNECVSMGEELMSEKEAGWPRTQKYIRG